MSTESLSTTIERAVSDVRSHLPKAARPKVGLILGSGLGGFADELGHRISVPFHKISGLPTSTVEGHKGALVYGKGGTSREVECLALQGRVHSYEGYSLQEVSFPARVLIAAGCRILVITNAAGGVDPTASIFVAKKVGEPVARGEALLRFTPPRSGDTAAISDEVRRRLAAAVVGGPTQPAAAPLLFEIIREVEE